MKNEIINEREKALLQIFWNEGRDMTSVELLDILDPDVWNKLSLLRTIKGLNDKNFIEVTGMVQYKTQYARKFKPTLTKEAFTAKMLLHNGIDLNSLGKVAAAMTENSAKEKKDMKKLIADIENLLVELKAN